MILTWGAFTTDAFILLVALQRFSLRKQRLEFLLKFPSRCQKYKTKINTTILRSMPNHIKKTEKNQNDTKNFVNIPTERKA